VRFALGALCCALLLTGCRRDVQPTAPPQTPLPALRQVDLTEDKTPTSTASPVQCQAACANGAALSALAESAGLNGLRPGLSPPPSLVQVAVTAGVAKCADECTRSTPPGVTTCLAAASSLPAMERCLR